MKDASAEVIYKDRWKTLLILGISQLMVVLDSSIVNIAIPRAKVDLGISDVNQQWVVTAYTLAFGSLLLVGGRIGDFFGRKTIFIVGLLGFAASSGLGGLVQNQGQLFAARAAQGVFGALLAPAVLSIISVTFLDPKERAKAFGVIGSISGGGAAIGLILGGTLTEYFSWRWCLGVNVPIAVVASLLAFKYLHESHAQGEHGFDIPSVLTSTAGLFALVYGFNRAATHGWTNSTTLTFFAASAVLLGAFIFIERRAKHPLMPLHVIGERNRGGAFLGSLVVGAGLFSMFLFLGLYLQVVRGYTPLHSGFAFLPFSVGIILTAGIVAQLLPKFGPKPLMVSGLVVASAALFFLAQITPTSDYWKHIFPALIFMSSGMAFVFIPITTTALHGVGNRDAGVASAVLNTSQQIGGSLGTALLNTVAATATTSYIVSHQKMGEAAKLYGMVHGFTSSFKVGAALLLVGAFILGLLINIGKESVVEHEGAGVVH